jgi:hypothetical protein
MEKNEWEKDDIKEFAKLLEQSERARKPTKEELKTINVGAGQDERELNIGTLLTTSERENLISLLRGYVDMFA